MQKDYQNKLYGCWLDKKGNMIPVSYQSHYEVAQAWLTTELKVKPNHTSSREYGYYKIMWRLGFVRVQFNAFDDGYNVEFWNHAKLTKAQKDFIKASDNKFEGGINIYSKEFYGEFKYIQ